MNDFEFLRPASIQYPHSSDLYWTHTRYFKKKKLLSSIFNNFDTWTAPFWCELWIMNLRIWCWIQLYISWMQSCYWIFCKIIPTTWHLHSSYQFCACRLKNWMAENKILRQVNTIPNNYNHFILPKSFFFLF